LIYISYHISDKLALIFFHSGEEHILAVLNNICTVMPVKIQAFFVGGIFEAVRGTPLIL
jgi:hypothetical protein